MPAQHDEPAARDPRSTPAYGVARGETSFVLLSEPTCRIPARIILSCSRAALPLHRQPSTAKHTTKGTKTHQADQVAPLPAHERSLNFPAFPHGEGDGWGQGRQRTLLPCQRRTQLSRAREVRCLDWSPHWAKHARTPVDISNTIRMSETVRASPHYGLWRGPRIRDGRIFQVFCWAGSAKLVMLSHPVYLGARPLQSVA